MEVTYVDFELQISAGAGRRYPVAVVRSPAGEARETMVFPFEQAALKQRLTAMEAALFRLGGNGQTQSLRQEDPIRQFGQELFNALFTGEIRSLYDVSRSRAETQQKGLRLKLHIQAPELAVLPWEFLYDGRQGEYVCLYQRTPLVRYLDMPQPVEPLLVTGPLRILVMIASPRDLPALDVNGEKERLEKATQALRERGVIELKWLGGQAWHDLQEEMRQGTWHLFHFIGHGGFDAGADDGVIALANETGNTHRLSATDLSRLVMNHRSLRLLVLNSCEGARGSEQGLFSSTAASLARHGIPAVVAMQYPISDRASLEFARSFYESLAAGLPVEAAITDARTAISVACNTTLEWGSPVLYMRSPDGVLFQMPRAPMVTGGAKQTPLWFNSARYRKNLALFLASIFLLIFWFYRHVQLYFAPSLLLGGPLTLFAIWEVLQSWLNWGIGRPVSTIIRNLLGRRESTRYLLGTLAVLGLLFVFTSSIYLEYNGAPPGNAVYKAEALANGNVYLKPLAVTSQEPKAGRPFFFRFRNVELQFEITEPGGYRREMRKFSPWSAIYLRVPLDFALKKTAVLRLVPGVFLLQNLPKPTSNPSNVRYYLKIIDPKATEPYVWNDVARQTIYIGATDDIHRVLGQLDKAEFRDNLIRYLDGRGYPPTPEARSYLFTAWEADPHEVSTRELQEGDRLIVEIGKEGQPPRSSQEVIVSSAKPVQTIFLEIPNG